jgi:hypothetical protein
MAVGDEDGKISILNLSEAVVQSRKSEKFALVNMLEREVKREKALLLKARKQRAQASNVSSKPARGGGGGVATKRATTSSGARPGSASTRPAADDGSGAGAGAGAAAAGEGDAAAAMLKQLEESFYASIQAAGE